MTEWLAPTTTQDNEKRQATLSAKGIYEVIKATEINGASIVNNMLNACNKVQHKGLSGNESWIDNYQFWMDDNNTEPVFTCSSKQYDAPIQKSDDIILLLAKLLAPRTQTLNNTDDRWQQLRLCCAEKHQIGSKIQKKSIFNG